MKVMQVMHPASDEWIGLRPFSSHSIYLPSPELDGWTQEVNRFIKQIQSAAQPDIFHLM